MRYVTTRDLVIPAGTVLLSPPTKSTRWASDYDGPVAVDRDHTCYVSMHPEEGVESGFLKAVTE